MFKSIVITAVAMTLLPEIDCKSVVEDLALTLRQKQVLDQFRQRMLPQLSENYMKTDLYLVRWLRVTNFNLDEAEANLKENLRWRASHKMETILNENFDDMFEEFPSLLNIYDLEDRPTVATDVSEWNFRQSALSGRLPRLMRFLDMLMENLTMDVYQRQRQGYNVTRWNVLINIQNFNSATHLCSICIPYFIHFLTAARSNYPGMMNSAIVIQAPPALQSIIQIATTALPRENIRVFGQNRETWVKYLNETFSQTEIKKFGFFLFRLTLT